MERDSCWQQMLLQMYKTLCWCLHTAAVLGCSVFLSTVSLFFFFFYMIKMLSTTSLLFLFWLTAVMHSLVFHCDRIWVIVSCVIGRPRQQKALSLHLSCALNVSLRYPYVRVPPKCLHKPIKSFWLQLGAALHFCLPAHFHSQQPLFGIANKRQHC